MGVRILWISLLVVGMFSSSNEFALTVFLATFFEIALTTSWKIYVFKFISDSNVSSKAKALEFFRSVILIVLNYTIGILAVVVDLLSFFILKSKFAFLNSGDGGSNAVSQSNANATSNLPLKCAKCGAELKPDYKFCASCGAEVVKQDSNISVNKVVKANEYDAMYSLDDNKMLDEFIKKEMKECEVDKSLLPQGLRTIKNVLGIIFSFLVLVYITMIFFHFPILTYVIGFVILVIYVIMMSKYNLVKYLKRQIKARPQEKIRNIVMNVKNTGVKRNYLVLIISLLVAVIAPLVVFRSPVILYEEMDNGYGVRFYLFGWSNYTSARIPEKFNGKPVVSLRGNTFSNMYFLKSVELPDTITEIRGQAFKNDFALESVNLPSNLEYLGGGAFYNCSSLESIEIPDSVTYIGGEIFYNATSLKSAKLSENITEIRGNSFENCTSLEEITIPDKVTRIGGHAFYGNTSLAQVNISENSELEEIGSSAFRSCSSLKSIVIPDDTFVNSRAFKNSPTKVLTYTEYSLGQEYEYDTLLYLKLHVENEINLYHDDAKIQDASLELISVERTGDTSKFKIKYTNGSSSSTFVLSADKMGTSINEDLYVEADDDVYFDSSYYTSIGLDVYYN